MLQQRLRMLVVLAGVMVVSCSSTLSNHDRASHGGGKLYLTGQAGDVLYTPQPSAIIRLVNSHTHHTLKHQVYSESRTGSKDDGGYKGAGGQVGTIDRSTLIPRVDHPKKGENGFIDQYKRDSEQKFLNLPPPDYVNPGPTATTEVPRPYTALRPPRRGQHTSDEDTEDGKQASTDAAFVSYQWNSERNQWQSNQPEANTHTSGGQYLHGLQPRYTPNFGLIDKKPQFQNIKNDYKLASGAPREMMNPPTGSQNADDYRREPEFYEAVLSGARPRAFGANQINTKLINFVLPRDQFGYVIPPIPNNLSPPPLQMGGWRPITRVKHLMGSHVSKNMSEKAPERVDIQSYNDPDYKPLYQTIHAASPNERTTPTSTQLEEAPEIYHTWFPTSESLTTTEMNSSPTSLDSDVVEANEHASSQTDRENTHLVYENGRKVWVDGKLMSIDEMMASMDFSDEVKFKTLRSLGLSHWTDKLRNHENTGPMIKDPESSLMSVRNDDDTDRMTNGLKKSENIGKEQRDNNSQNNGYRTNNTTSTDKIRSPGSSRIIRLRNRHRNKNLQNKESNGESTEQNIAANSPENSTIEDMLNSDNRSNKINQKNQETNTEDVMNKNKNDVFDTKFKQLTPTSTDQTPTSANLDLTLNINESTSDNSTRHDTQPNGSHVNKASHVNITEFEGGADKDEEAATGSTEVTVILASGADEVTEPAATNPSSTATPHVIIYYSNSSSAEFPEQSTTSRSEEIGDDGEKLPHREKSDGRGRLRHRERGKGRDRFRQRERNKTGEKPFHGKEEGGGVTLHHSKRGENGESSSHRDSGDGRARLRHRERGEGRKRLRHRERGEGRNRLRQRVKGEGKGRLRNRESDVEITSENSSDIEQIILVDSSHLNRESHMKKNHKEVDQFDAVTTETVNTKSTIRPHEPEEKNHEVQMNLEDTNKKLPNIVEEKIEMATVYELGTDLESVTRVPQHTSTDTENEETELYANDEAEPFPSEEFVNYETDISSEPFNSDDTKPPNTEVVYSNRYGTNYGERRSVSTEQGLRVRATSANKSRTTASPEDFFTLDFITRTTGSDSDASSGRSSLDDREDQLQNGEIEVISDSSQTPSILLVKRASFPMIRLRQVETPP